MEVALELDKVAFLPLVFGDDLELIGVERRKGISEKGERQAGILVVDGLGESVMEVFGGGVSYDVGVLFFGAFNEGGEGVVLEGVEFLEVELVEELDSVEGEVLK